MDCSKVLVAVFWIWRQWMLVTRCIAAVAMRSSKLAQSMGRVRVSVGAKIHPWMEPASNDRFLSGILFLGRSHT